MATLHEKLERLLKFAHKGRISAAAGLAPGTLSNIIYRKIMPRTDTLQKLAILLNVKIGWLLDDTKDFPAERTKRREIGSPLVLDAPQEADTNDTTQPNTNNAA